MRVLGLDFGDRSIGLAVSDKLHLTAQGIGRYRVKNKKEDKKFFRELVSKYEVNEIVIGLPLRMNGTPGTRAEKTKQFAHWLEEKVKIPVIFWDERLTSKQALKILQQQKANRKTKKSLKDQISAVLILSNYLENKRTKNYDSQNH
ncbi:MAG: Holliday junction resolvase RuvX [Candidatus Aminicenantes bacterium]